MISDPSTHHDLVDGVGVPLVTERCAEVAFTGVGAGYEVERHGYFQTPLSKEPDMTRRKVVNEENQRYYIIRDLILRMRVCHILIAQPSLRTDIGSAVKHWSL